MSTTTENKKLGTFLGVYTPTILTILGVIMYLRFGWLVGQLGLARVLVVVLLANCITVVTTLSFSSVATNSKVGAGGAYFVISRSLGIEIGGSIGYPLFLSQAFSATLYAYGLAESLRFVWPDLHVPVVTLVILASVGILALLGAESALKAQIPLMGLVVLSVVALTIGVVTRASDAPIVILPPGGAVGFWAGFAVFFPAVTGVMAGLGLSGDLKNPGRAIPLGSLAAVATGFAVYLIVPVLLTIGAAPEELRNEPLIWTRIAVLGPWLVFPGLWAAIFSSAVGSVLAAPRTLQALARDGIAPRLLRKFRGGRWDILPGLIVSMIIAMCAVLLGNLNAVAAVVSMFFLTVYGTVNIVAAFEALSGDPSWRPKIKIPWLVNLAGGVACIVVMMLINPLAGVIAFIAEISLWFFLSRRAQKARWGDARRGLYENLIRWALIHLSRRPFSARSWRPHMLIFVDEPVRELDLVRFGDWFSQGRGVVTVCNLIVGDLESDDIDLPGKRAEMQEAMNAEELVVFAEVDVVHHIVSGIVAVAQANGMAGLTSNTVMLGWPSDESLRCEFLRALRKLERLNKSLILGRIQPKYLFHREQRTIHVWWGGIERNGDLMLLLAFLLKCNPEWRDAKVEVMSIASSEMMRARTEAHLNELIPDIRIDATPRVLIKPKDVSVTELIQRESADAEVVFLGLGTPKPGEEAEYAKRLETLAGELPVVFFVKNASMFIGELLESPEEEFEEVPEEESEEGSEKDSTDANKRTVEATRQDRKP
jgi:amino acid transporter